MRTNLCARAAVSAVAACLPLWAGSVPIALADQYAEDLPPAADISIATRAGSTSVGIAGSPLATAKHVIAQDVPVAQKGAPVFDGTAAALDPDQLALYRGGSDTVNNDMQLSGIVGNNSAIDVVTGSNSIGGASFSNASGLPMVIQNSGANVLIQNATIINVQVK